jgi:hypothetical protein
MRRFYKQSLCIPQNLLLTNQDLHHGLLGTQSFANVKNEAERKELEGLFSTNKSRLLGLHGSLQSFLAIPFAM